MSSQKMALRWLWRQTGRVRAPLAGAGMAGIAGGALQIAQAWLLASVVTAVVFENAGRTKWLYWAGVLMVVFLLRALVRWAREACGFAAGARVREHTRMALLNRLFNAGPLKTGRTSAGAMATATLEQVESLQGFYELFLPQLVVAAVVPLMILAAIFPLNWAAGGLLALTAPLIPFFMMLVGMGAESVSQRNFQALARLGGHFLDVLRGMITLKLLGRIGETEKTIAEVSDQYRRQTMQVLRIAFLSSAVLEFFSSLAIALVAVYLGMNYLGYFDFGTWGRPLTFQHGFFILLLAPDYFAPLRELGQHYHARAEAVGAATELGRLDRMLKVDPAPDDPIDNVPAAPFAIKFENLRVIYDDAIPALDGIDLKVPPGQRVAVVGPSGAGKTTLLNVLLGFVAPSAGAIRINGQSLASIDCEKWRRHIAWLGQHPFLFHGTIGENILLGRPDADARQLAQAVEIAQLTDFVRQLPKGIDTPIGEAGARLSRGQSQRVALARALIKRAPLLLLDEPTASLDAENERIVTQALMAPSAARTMIWLTHRLDHLQAADRIVVLQAGKIVETGTYDDLLNAKGLFYQMVEKMHTGAEELR